MWQNTDSYWIQVKDTQVFLILSFQCYYGFKIFFKWEEFKEKRKKKIFDLKSKIWESLIHVL